MKLFSPTPIRRYTPPTCTLEIWAKPSALSFWGDRPLIKELNFELRFDDPRIPDEKQVIVRGDREKLVQLYEVVTTYVQNTLLQRSLQIPVGIETLALPSSTTEAVESPSHSHLALTTSEDTAIVAFPKAPTLKPKGLLSHQLTFNSLAQDAPEQSIQLSVSQLFDLAEALEQFSTEMDILPSLNKAKHRKAAVIWASTAAAAILAVGISTVGVKIYQTASEKNDIATSQGASNSQSAQSNIQDVVPPVPPPPPSPVPSPTLPPALAGRDTLPPPPSVPEPISPRRVPPVLLPPPSLPPAPRQSTIAVVPESSKKTNPSAVNPTTLPPRENSAVPKKPDLPALPPIQANSPMAENPVDAASAEAPATLQTSPSRDNSSNASSANVPNTTAFAPPQERTTDNLLDTIPQVAEVRQYFQERWQVPKGLNQRLEYRLILNKEGSIARISPLGRAANVYLDRTQMPLMGDPFVSPLEVANNATIRLVLNPDGSVKTFLEE
ncbi:DUF4335 domain-containing protein [Candidatus Gracilibacteria bacterium]|jgi:Domain of unknown function (DUF4335)|nr:DUF4335 domain-containing protein [Candidatus Gracilibacteria bacterium]NJM90033.1 DUF4335 domain-containing protein [Hydrococcus sp. RU_2_2]NJP18659.1 DUF4335 domain-containing protein [Hydrococcus sp. CRU_1_1]